MRGNLVCGAERFAERRIEKSKRALEAGSLERQIGRLLKRNARAAARYNVVDHCPWRHACR